MEAKEACKEQDFPFLRRRPLGAFFISAVFCLLKECSVRALWNRIRIDVPHAEDLASAVISLEPGLAAWGLRERSPG